MARLIWSPEAVKDLEGICEYIARDSTHYARVFAIQHDSAAVPPWSGDDAGREWKRIEGELIILPDPARTLPPIDRLEGFRPKGTSLYRWVLVPVQLSGERTTLT